MWDHDGIVPVYYHVWMGGEQYTIYCTSNIVASTSLQTHMDLKKRALNGEELFSVVIVKLARFISFTVGRVIYSLF